MNGLSSFIALALWRSLLLGAASALLMVLDISLRAEIWNERTITLVVIWFLGGFSGGLAASTALPLLLRLCGEKLAPLLRALAFPLAFVAAGAFVFYLQNTWQRGLELHPEHPVRSLIFGSMQVAALFAYTMSRYMLPWMAPVMALLGYALLPNQPRPPEG